MKVYHLGRYLRYIYYGLIIYLASYATHLLAQSPEKTEAGKEISWVVEANKLISDLNTLAEGISEPQNGDYSYAKAVAYRYKIDRIIWNLWLTTGMPPTARSEYKESLHKYAKHTVSLYKQYVNDHAQLSLEDLQRRGLHNAVTSFGSPLYYMTIKYLTKKMGFDTEMHFEILPSPNFPIIDVPLTEEAYKNLSFALSVWLEENRDNIVWNPKKNCYTAKDGKYKETNTLMKAVIYESFSSAEADKLLSELRPAKRKVPALPNEGQANP